MFTISSIHCFHVGVSFHPANFLWSWKTSISYGTYLLMIHLLRFCPKCHYVAFILKGILAGHRIFGWQLSFPFFVITSDVLSHCRPARIVFVETSLPSTYFWDFLFSIGFSQLIMMCLPVFSFYLSCLEWGKILTYLGVYFSTSISSNVFFSLQFLPSWLLVLYLHDNTILWVSGLLFIFKAFFPLWALIQKVYMTLYSHKLKFSLSF